MSKRIVYDTANVSDRDFAMPMEEVRSDIHDKRESGSMSATSKLAEEIIGALSGFGHLSATVVDAELAPVRECLERLCNDGCYDACWIRWGKEWGDDTYHSSACLAAQQLYERLQIQ